MQQLDYETPSRKRWDPPQWLVVVVINCTIWYGYFHKAGDPDVRLLQTICGIGACMAGLGLALHYARRS
jgi:hypothetical protein